VNVTSVVPVVPPVKKDPRRASETQGLGEAREGRKSGVQKQKGDGVGCRKALWPQELV
jgi:hypothetical protein